MKRLNPGKSLAVSLVMALLLSMVGMQGSLASDYLVAEENVLTPFTGSISLDVNPSIELIIENGIVTQALAYNDDGQSLLTDHALSGLTAEEAVKAMTKALVEGGYLAPADVKPYLVITMSGVGVQQEDAAEALQDAAKQVAQELGAQFEVKSTFVSDDVLAQATAAGLSTGKFLLLQYIVSTEGITLEEAIAKYGAAKIGELMDQFKDAEDLFDGDELALTEEQRAVLESAFEQQKKSIKAAEGIFHDAFKALKSAYREKVHSAIKANKRGDAQALTDTLNQLKDQMMAEYQTIRQALDGAVSAARATFLEVVTAAGIPESVSSEYYNWHMNKELNPEGELKAFLKEFTVKADEMETPSEDEDQDEDQDQDKDEDEDRDEDQDKDKDEDKEEDQDEDKEEDQDEDKEEDQDEDKDQDKDQGKGKDQGNGDSNKSKTENPATSHGKSDNKDNNSGKGKK